MEQPAESKQARTILWVEDEASMESLARQRLREDLRAGKYVFEFAATVRAAKEFITKHPKPPIVLCDINLPDGNGLDVLAHIDEIFGNEAVVVMVTAYDDMTTIRKAMQRGAFDFLTKPIDFDDLKITIERSFEYQEVQSGLKAERKNMLRVEQEMELARSIQMGLLIDHDRHLHGVEAVEVASQFLPANHLGGVMYDHIPLRDKRHLVFMANVSGTGLSGALYMARVQSILHTLSRATRCETPGQILDHLNQLLWERNTAGYFVTCFLGIYDPPSGSIDYVCAGHRAPLLGKSGSMVTSLELSGDMALGVKERIQFQERTYTMLPGQTLLLYNHGVVEIKNPSGVVFGEPGVRNLFAQTLSATGIRSCQHLVDAMLKGLRHYVDTWQLGEDIAMLALRRV